MPDTLSDALANGLQREPQHVFLRREVVLDQTHGHAGLSGDVAQADGVQPVPARDPPEGLGDQPPPRVVVNCLGMSEL